MSDYPGLSSEQYINELRKDIRGTAKNRTASEGAAAEFEIARLEEAAKAVSKPDPDIMAELRALRLSLFG